MFSKLKFINLNYWRKHKRIAQVSLDISERNFVIQKIKLTLMVSFSFSCHGHSNVTSRHKSTLEFTTDSDLSLRGDCILGVRATANLNGLPSDIKKLLRNEKTRIKMMIRTADYTEEIWGNGHPELQLSDKTAIIVRKSDFICPRTLMIKANKSAIDISNEIRYMMKNPDSKMEVTIHLEEGSIETSKQA